MSRESSTDTPFEVGDIVSHRDVGEGQVWDVRDGEVRVWWEDDSYAWEKVDELGLVRKGPGHV